MSFRQTITTQQNERKMKKTKYPNDSGEWCVLHVHVWIKKHIFIESCNMDILATLLILAGTALDVL